MSFVTVVHHRDVLVIQLAHLYSVCLQSTLHDTLGCQKLHIVSSLKVCAERFATDLPIASNFRTIVPRRIFYCKNGHSSTLPFSSHSVSYCPELSLLLIRILLFPEARALFQLKSCTAGTLACDPGSIISPKTFTMTSIPLDPNTT